MTTANILPRPPHAPSSVRAGADRDEGRRHRTAQYLLATSLEQSRERRAARTEQATPAPAVVGPAA
ncbi:hypothetical protein [Streptomyces sp. OE57]|uniref:hypothetical protein n=1 Tax=Streptomyces lacaronensis TaxID=3379885 RepID=UPI0039B75700